MTRLILETVLLLLGAYFLGAWVACLVKRSFFAPKEAVPNLGRYDAPSVAARATAIAPSTPIAPPVRRADPKPIAIETIERTSPQAAENAASRFEQVLTQAPAAASAPMVKPAAPQTIAPTPAAPPVNRTAPAVTPAKPVESATTTAATVVAASAAVVSAPVVPVAKAITPSQPSVPPQSRPVAASPQPSLPAASSSSGPASVAAPIAQAAASVADELSRIRAIDPAIGASLIKLGVARYRDIAAWLPADVARISKALGFSGRIEQENWIEQAQILARGGETAYARRKDRGETTIMAPETNLPATAPIVAAPSAAASVGARPTVVVPQSAPVAAAAPISAGASSVVSSGPAMLPRVEERAAFADQPKVQAAPLPVSPAPVAPKAVTPAPAVHSPPGGEPGLAGAATSAAAAGLGAAASSGRDNLQRIGGINAEVEKLLNAQSVLRYAQISSWTAADAMRFDRLLGQEGRVKRENWIEQAQMLARGGDTAFSRHFDQRQASAAAGSAADAARPSRLSDAIRDTAAKTVAEPVTARAPDLSALRSVRSEAYTGAGQSSGSRSAQPDDLKRVRGVGVLIEKKLNSMGVTTYAQMANWSASDIDRVSQVLDFRGRIERENWVEQARILSAGGQTEFSRRVDRGEVETSKIK